MVEISTQPYVKKSCFSSTSSPAPGADKISRRVQSASAKQNGISAPGALQNQMTALVSCKSRTTNHLQPTITHPGGCSRSFLHIHRRQNSLLRVACRLYIGLADGPGTDELMRGAVSYHFFLAVGTIDSDRADARN